MQNLSLKFRPPTFDAVIGQKDTLVGLQNYLSQADRPQSILLSGPRGTGKTTTARLITKALNCQEENKPCGGQCSICNEVAAGTFVDMYELDGATNGGIDAVRQIVEMVYHSPIHRFKVVIIDEAHMLTRAAANALLKTLEEPPPGVVFILCTTEEHKLLPTIKSRLKIYRFHLIDPALVKAHLTYICEQEGIKVSDSIMDFIIAEGGGSMRDSIRTLDQVRELGEGVTMEQVLENVGLASYEQVAAYIGSLIVKDLVDAFQLIKEISSNAEIPMFYQQVMDYCQQLLYVTLHLDVGQVPSQSIINQAEKINDSWVLSLLEILLKWNRQGGPINRLKLEAATVEMIRMGDTPKPTQNLNTERAMMELEPIKDDSTLSFIKRKLNQKEEEILPTEEAQF